MHLGAISIGCAVPRMDFHATIHSVFRSAINLSRSKDDLLLTLVLSSEPDLPQGIRLDTPDDFSFKGYTTGEQAICCDEVLRIGSLKINLHGARCWKCDLPALQPDFSNPAVAAAWKIVRTELNKRQVLFGAEITAQEISHSGEIFQSRVASNIRKAMRELIIAARSYSESVTSPIKELIGLGTGLTPRGDDLLLGFLAGLWCSVRGKNERLRFVSNLAEAVVQNTCQTNDISRTYLYHASHGQVSNLLVNLAQAISLGQDYDHLIEISESSMRVGHTSGMDTVTGLLIGLAAFEGDFLYSIIRCR
jgi:hypothetical protein